MCDTEFTSPTNSASEAKKRAVRLLLAIYILRRKMGGFLDKPKTEKSVESGHGNGMKYGVVSMQGWRVEMEDSHSAITGLPGDLKDWSYFAVFDGHCGSGVSAHSAQNLLPTILQTDEFQKMPPQSNVQTDSDNVKSILQSAIHTGFLQLDATMREMPDVVNGDDKSGTTAVCALISPSHFYIANCGDSRAVLCRKGVPAVCTLDHKPTVPAEKERIQRAGGSVMIHRVNGSLAVSRALGDFEYKSVEGKGPTEQLVSPAPEIFIEARCPEGDEFLVIACDGIWDVMTNEDVCQFIHHQLTLTDDITKVAASVVDYCLFKGSRDNMSIVLVLFPAAPKPIAEVVEREKKFEAFIKRRTLEIMETDSTVEASRVLQLLNEEDIPDLPAGSNLGAKRSFIESLLESSKNKSTEQE